MLSRFCLRWSRRRSGSLLSPAFFTIPKLGIFFFKPSLLIFSTIQPDRYGSIGGDGMKPRSLPDIIALSWSRRRMDTGHGGNLAAVSDQYGWPPEEILDFSASINPFGPPKKARDAFRESFKQITTYPDPDCRRLRRRMGALLSVPEDQILIGNGSTELIFLIPRTLSPRSIFIFYPTYQDYGASAQATRCRVQFALLPLASTVDHFHSALSHARSGVDLVFLCNPNNPTGSCLSA